MQATRPAYTTVLTPGSPSDLQAVGHSIIQHTASLKHVCASLAFVGHGSWAFMSVPLVILGRHPCQHTPSPQAIWLHLHRATAPVSNGRSEHLTAILVSASVPAPTVDQHCMCLERWARLHSESNAQGEASVPMAMALRYVDSLRYVDMYSSGEEHAACAGESMQVRLSAVCRLIKCCVF